MFKRGTLSRRGFLHGAAASLAATGVPTWYAHELLAAYEEKTAEKKPTGANERLNLGIIGIDNKVRRNVALYGLFGFPFFQTPQIQASIGFVGSHYTSETKREHALRRFSSLEQRMT